MLAPGSEVTIKVENIMWPYRDRYAPGVIRDEYNFYTGTVVYEKWYIGIWKFVYWCMKTGILVS